MNRLLVPFIRFRMHMLRLYRKRRAANKIAALRRAYVQKKKYVSLRSAVIQLQSFQRRKAATSYVETLRDPYIRMTYKEVKKLLAKERSRLEVAVRNKDFKAAAELEAKM